MNTVVSFFAGILVFLSGLFGYSGGNHATSTPSNLVVVEPNYTQSTSSDTDFVVQTNGSPTDSESLYFNEDPGDGSRGTSTAKTTIINNSLEETLFRDYSADEVQIFYKNKDGSRLYFNFFYRKGCGAVWCEGFLKYLDGKEQKYHSTNYDHDGPLGGHKYPLVLPYLIQKESDFKSLTLVNLDQNKKKKIYSVNSDLESLFSECKEWESMFDGGFDYTYEINITEGGKIKIGVYKNSNQNTQPCTKENVGKYEKIRDDVVDLEAAQW